MIKKVMMINPVNYGRQSYRVPAGLLIIASVFAREGVEIAWIDADALRDDSDEIKKQIVKNLDADLIAAGGLHTSYKSVKQIFQFLAGENVTIPTLIGGKLAQTLDYLIWKRIPGVDMLCKQEGEYVVESLCKHFPDVARVSGIEYRSNGKIVSNDPAPIVQSLDEDPPYRWDLLDKGRYFSKGVAHLISSRGCPYACKFCRYPDPLSRNQRVLSAERILEEIRMLVGTYGVRTIYFQDEFFLLNKERVVKLCDALEREKLKIKWIVSSRADAIKEQDASLLRLMRKLGCTHISMGIESGSQEMLDAMGKGLKIGQVETAIKVIQKAGIRLKPAFIFGFPGETRETALESVNWRLKMERWGLANVNKKGKYFYATPYPGSPLYDYFVKRYKMSLDREERWLMKSASLKHLNVNLTDMTLEELGALDSQCRELLKNSSRNHVIKSWLKKIEMGRTAFFW